jgi:hypothetical protein
MLSSFLLTFPLLIVLYRKSSIIKSNSFRREILANNEQDEDKEAYLSAKTEAMGTHQHNEKAEMRNLA